jgi:hypothetical protein
MPTAQIHRGTSYAQFISPGAETRKQKVEIRDYGRRARGSLKSGEGPKTRDQGPGAWNAEGRMKNEESERQETEDVRVELGGPGAPAWLFAESGERED